MLVSTRVLVVDDSADDRQWLISLLREARSADEIVQADSLATAARLIEAQHVDLVIADHSLPDPVKAEAYTFLDRWLGA